MRVGPGPFRQPGTLPVLPEGIAGVADESNFRIPRHPGLIPYCARMFDSPLSRRAQARSKRSRFITLFQDATKSHTNACCESLHA